VIERIDDFHLLCCRPYNIFTLPSAQSHGRSREDFQNRGLTVELQRSVYPSVGLLEGVAYAEDAWIDILLGYDGFNIQFVPVIPERFLFFHEVRGWGTAALKVLRKKVGGK
jgi:hypothetical protein